MPDNLPSRRISREALERVIQRAAELQADEMDTGDGITEQELLKVGAEVGIDGRFLRQAIYEESGASRAAAERGVVARWVGPGVVYAGRVVPGDRDTVERAVEHWMTDREALTIKRRLPDRTLWERQKGFFAEVKRGFGVGGRAYHLAKARDVTVVVTQLEKGFCHVQASADIADTRAGFWGGGIAAGGGLAAAGVVAAAAGAPVVVPIFAAVTAFGVGAAITSGHRRVAERMQLALEQVLDRLERDEIKPRHQLEPEPLFPFGRIALEIRRAITDATDASRRPARRLPPTQ